MIKAPPARDMVAVEAAVAVGAGDLEVAEEAAVSVEVTAMVAVDEEGAVEVLAAVAVMEVNKLISQAVLEIGNVPYSTAATQTSPGGMNVTNVKRPNPLGPEEVTVIVVVAVALEAEEEDSAAAGVVTEPVEVLAA